MPEISVIIPVFNEEQAVGGVIDELVKTLARLPVEYEIIAVDDGSTDDTKTILKARGVDILEHVYNMGYGASIKTGLRHASGSKVLIIDGDGTYPPGEIAKLFEHKDDYDMVVGSRTGDSVNVEAYRKPAKFILNQLANYLSGVKIPDLNSGLRIISREKALEFLELCPSGFSFTTTITLAFLSNDYTVKYVPINYGRRVGESKIRPIRDGMNFMILIIRSIVYFNPLKVFLPVSALLFTASLAVFLYSWVILGRVMDITVTVILMSSVQVALFGLLADMLAKKK
ncbi:MAG: glycosyltransferase family 2 protein [Candidatus Altiarchaeota archaeon]